MASIKQNQAVKAAADGAKLAQTLAETMREIMATTNHVTATGLASDLQTIALELVAWAAWDGTDPVPSIVAVNPRYKPEYIVEYEEVRRAINSTPDTSSSSSSSSDVIEVEYIKKRRRNPQHTPLIPQYIFKSSTGLEVNSDGTLTGTQYTAAQLLTMLQISAALDTFIKSTPSGFSDTVGNTLESVVTI